MLPSIFGENLFDDFFDDAFQSPFFSGKNPLYGKRAKNLMKTDVKEGKDSYQVSIDLPGFHKEDIQVELKDGYLTVTAQKDLNEEEKNEDAKYIRQERYSGTCSRSFYVGDLKPEEVKCKYESGVLQLTLPKKAEQKALPNNRINID